MAPRGGITAHDDEDVEEHLLDTRSIRSTASSSKTLVRPPTYYGDGPFDAPSSDSSEEGDALLEDKESLDEEIPRSRSPGHAEDGLYVGGAPQSVRAPPFPMNAADCTVAQGSDAISSHRPGQSGRLVRNNRHIRFTIVLGEGVSVSRAGCQEDHDGPRLQRHILRGDEGLALGEGGYVAF